jgi:nucleotide-binding universal stress UspA family protein
LISKILVAVDVTPSGNKTLDFGLDIAEKYGASVLILNVLDIPVYSTPADAMTLSADNLVLIKDLRKVHERILTKAAELATASKPNVPVRTELREGNPSDQIVLTAAEGNFDLIVIGRGDESKARKFFLGSTSERVVQTAKCAVLIVK